jgi:hypothetical protein
MNKLFDIVLEELDIIVKEEYGKTYSLSLFEANDDSDDVLSTPISRVASFPARALRFRKAKSVMLKYAKKILAKTDKIIKKFELEIDKSVPQITRRGEDLQKELDSAKKSGDEIGARAIINQQKKFTQDVKKNQDDRVNTLNQAIENLITTYTTAIHKRIDEPGYVLKVELSEKGKAELKFMWEELISGIKQKSYEKLVKIINNKNIKGLESLVARLEIEIEEAEDRRYQNKRSRISNRSEEEDSKRGLKKILNDPKSEFEKLVAYLNDLLEKNGRGIDDNYIAAVDSDGELETYDVSFNIDRENEEIEAKYFKKDSDDLVKVMDIENENDADDVIDDIEAAIKISASDKEDTEQERLSKFISSKLDTLLKNPTKDTERKLGDYKFIIDNYKKNQELFVDKFVEVILDKENVYKKEIAEIKNGNITPLKLVDLLKQLADELDYESAEKTGKQLKDAEDKFDRFEDWVREQISKRNLSEKNWRQILNDIIFSGSSNIVPSIYHFFGV